MRYLLVVLLVLCAVPAFAATATLNWGDNSTNEGGFEVERAPAACSPIPTTFAKVGEVGVNVKTYVDNAPVDGNRYCWRVRAWNLMFTGDTTRQYSGYTNLAGKDFPLPAPAAPGGLTAE